MVSGAFEHPNSQCRAGARRSQEIPRDRHTPVWALAVWLLGQRAKLNISFIGWFPQVVDHHAEGHLQQSKYLSFFAFF
jgi:hypothetical protein